MIGLGLGMHLKNLLKKDDSAVVGLFDDFPASHTEWFLPVQLRSNYNQCCIVRRASDDVEQSFNYANGLFPSAAVASFCGASNGYIVQIYDSSGNNRHWYQTTAANQPIIYDGTSIVTTSGVVSLNCGNNIYCGLDCDNLGTASTATLISSYKAAGVSDLMLTSQVNTQFQIGCSISGDSTPSYLNVGAPTTIVNKQQIGTSRDNLSTAEGTNTTITAIANLNMSNTQLDDLRTTAPARGYSAKQYMSGLILYYNDQSSNIIAMSDKLNTIVNAY